MRLSSVRTKHWTRVEYEWLVDLGAFRPGERLELVGGALLVREPQGSPHATAVGLTEDALREAFGVGWTVRAQSPIALDEASEPEPDIAAVPGTRRDYRRAHPSHPVLIVEVVGSSLELDRGEKASLYASARLTDYWVVNLVDNVLEVYRDPVADPDAPYRWRYGSTATLRAGDFEPWPPGFGGAWRDGLTRTARSSSRPIVGRDKGDRLPPCAPRPD